LSVAERFGVLNQPEVRNEAQRRNEVYLPEKSSGDIVIDFK
jgi:hypothetical protein